jgi:putative heme iron utilization protein
MRTATATVARCVGGRTGVVERGGRLRRRVVRRASGVVVRTTNDDDGSSDAVTTMERFIEQLQRHEKHAQRLSMANESRKIIDTNTTGTLSTIGNSKSGGALRGFPCGGVVGYASDARGAPTFALSAMSQHTRDVMENPRATLTVTCGEFESVADGRVSLSGFVRVIEDEEERREAREAYLKTHPGAYWVDFGDFTWFKMTDIAGCRIVGGFARAGSVSASEYEGTTRDPVAGFSRPVCGHMNADHGDALVAMAKRYAGLECDSVEMRSIDALGINCRVTKRGETFSLRLPFESPAMDRKAVKEQIVLMTKAAAAAAAE